ncbi:hypothetical protein [Dickeya dianthicola]|uniref:hypothetical protein n=1 Tax=Dickeya dianthicola TaxID=204039 RepID=UPI001367D85E|nr:hypothetical protein [Dickeya dianthicola]MCI4235641.1 hypothetical protein [Dickeya dianthicola]MCI4255773.1 hypothetical protein [Dickeya dianthicola]
MSSGKALPCFGRQIQNHVCRAHHDHEIGDFAFLIKFNQINAEYNVITDSGTISLS